MIKHINGNIFNSDAEIICHQVNCQGKFGRGMAGQIKKIYPTAYEDYIKNTINCIKHYNGDTSKLLGQVLFSEVRDHKFIAHLYGQNFYGKDGKVYTCYPFLKIAMEKVRDYSIISHCNKIAIPHGIGCGNAGGDWNVVDKIIKEVFIDFPKTVEIWKFGW